MDFGVNFKIKKYRMLGFLFIGSVGSYIKTKGVGGKPRSICLCVVTSCQNILGCSTNHYFSFSPKEHGLFKISTAVEYI